MDFKNATLLSFNKKFDFISNTLRYKSSKELSIEGLLLDLTNSQDVNGVITQLIALQKDTDNWNDIILNGYNFGKGIITKLDFSSGNDIRTKKYTVSVSIPETGDFSSLAANTKDYSGLDFTNFQYIDGFSESSNFDITNKKETYNQSIRFSLKGPYSLDTVTAAKTIANVFFSNNNLQQTAGSRYNNSAIKKYYSESYDVINNTYEFSRNYELNTDSNNQYSVNRTCSLQFDANGIASVTEKSDYIGHTTTPFDTALAAANSDISNAYGRCTTVLSNYSSDSNSLVNNPVSKSFTLNRFDGRASYTIVYSNALKISSYNAYWEYQTTIDRSEGETYTVSEEGTITGFGHINQIKFSNAQSAWSNISSGIGGRINSLNIPNLQFLSDSTVLQKIEGKISYTKKYTNSTALRNDQSIRRAIVTISQQYPRNLSQTYNVINYKEIIQKSSNLSASQISYSVNLNGRADTSINNYLSTAKSYISSTNTDYISDVNYRYDPFNRQFSLSVGFMVLG